MATQDAGVSERANTAEPGPAGAGKSAARSGTVARWRPAVWQRCVASGLLLAGAFPALDLPILAYIGLIPFLTCFPFARPRHAFWRGFLCGFAFYGALLYWIGVFTYHVIGALSLVAWAGTAAIQAFWIGLFALVANWCWPRLTSPGRILAIPSLWVMAEWARQLGTFGMGWGDLAYSQWRLSEIRLLAPITGIWGVSWLIVAIAMMIRENPRRALVPVVCLLLIVLGVTSIGHEPVNRPAVGGYPVAAAIQANINQDVPWNDAYYNGAVMTFRRMIDQASGKGASLVVLAETALPGYADTMPELRQSVTGWARRNRLTIVAGGLHYDFASRKAQNVVYEVSPTGDWSAPYAKTRLVPFGEYVPYRRLFPFLEALHASVYDMKAGGYDQPPLSAAGSLWRVGPMICYESAYAGFARQQALRGASVLVVVTDDTWFGHTAAARQHEAMAAFRAAETHRPLVRCAATGISAVFDQDGRLVSQVGLFRQAVLAEPIAPQTDRTFYVRHGDWFVVVCAALVVFGLIGLGLRKAARGR